MSSQHSTAALERDRRIRIEPLDAPLGAEVKAVDLSRSLTDVEFGRIRTALFEHGLLLFRGQQLTPAEQVRFSRRFGELERHVFSHWCLAEHPEILIVTNLRNDGQPIGVYNAGRYWHTDLSYMPAPSLASMLYALEVPHDGDRALGNTFFAGTAAAYDTLAPALRERIADSSAEFSLAHQRRKLMDDGDAGAALSDTAKASTPPAVHRIVQPHPVTGRPALYVNEGHTVRILGLSPSESDELLAQLCSHITQPGNVYCHEWRVGDVLMWDNAATQHLATFDYALPQRRYMYRTTIKGPVLG